MKTILIIEDDPFHRNFLITAFEGKTLQNFELCVCENGEKALEHLGHNEINCAIVDLQLPGKSGIDIAKVIWKNQPAASILFWSNFADPAYVRAITKIVPEGCNFGYLLKTTSLERLKRSIIGVFDDHQRVIDSEVRGLLRPSQKSSSELNEIEYEILHLLAIGMTDKAISTTNSMSVRSVQSAIQTIHEKIVSKSRAQSAVDQFQINRRCRTVAIALLEGILNRDSLEHYEMLFNNPE